MHEFRLHKEKQRMKNIESYVRVSGDSIKDTNPKTLELWNKAIEEEEYGDIIPLKEGDYLVDAFLYARILEACAYNKDLDTYNIPNVNFTLIDRGDERWDRFKQQRLERGFDDSETWSLDSTIAKFIEPRLRRFKEIKAGYPASMSEEEWDATLDKMIYAFECINKDNTFDNEEYVNEGLDLFRKHFFKLWW